MKITIDLDLLDNLFEEEEDGEIADSFLNDAYFAFSPEELSAIGKRIASGEAPSLAYRRYLLQQLDQEAKEAYARVQVGYGLEDIAELDPSKLTDNPYYQAVMGVAKSEKRIGAWAFGIDHYAPYALFVYDEVRPCPDGFGVYSPIGFYAKGLPYPALKQNGRTYMSLIPHEINTMAGPIEKAHGHVATMGLGMGYFAYMASNKDEVASLTILERDKSVIALFNEVFLPLFPHKEKIRILAVDDALAYRPEEPFDYLFMDLHHDAEDGLPAYMELLRIQGLAKTIDVWIEKALLHYLRRHVIALIEEEADGYGDEDYQGHGSFSERLLCSLHFHLKNYELSDEASLIHLLSDQTLRALSGQIKLR